MVAEALKEKVMNYFTLLDDEQAQMVISKYSLIESQTFEIISY